MPTGYMDPKKYDGPERRKYFRYNIIYAPKERARLEIDNDQFEVLDFSRGGLRFFKDNPADIENRFQGKLIFSDGTTKEIKAEIVWELNNEVGIKYIS